MEADGPCRAGSSLPVARRETRVSAPQGRGRVTAAAPRRIPVRAGRAPRRRPPVRPADRLPGRKLLDPTDALRARIGLLPTPRTDSAGTASLSPPARIAPARPRPL